MKWKKKCCVLAWSCVAALAALALCSILGCCCCSCRRRRRCRCRRRRRCYIYILYESIYTECVHRTCIYLQPTHLFDGIYTRAHTIPTATIIRAVHTNSDRIYGPCCCCCFDCFGWLDCLCCTDRITNTHSVDKLLGVFFFFFFSFPYISPEQHSHLLAQPRHRE